MTIRRPPACSASRRGPRRGERLADDRRELPDSSSVRWVASVSSRPRSTPSRRALGPRPVLLARARDRDVGTSPGRGVRGGLALAPARDVAFRRSDSVGTPDSVISRLNSLACTFPCRRFTGPLTGRPCTARGHRGSLALRCRTPPFLTPCRFIPALQNFLDFSPTLETHWATFDLRSVALPDPALAGFVVTPPVG